MLTYLLIYGVINLYPFFTGHIFINPKETYLECGRQTIKSIMSVKKNSLIVTLIIFSYLLHKPHTLDSSYHIPSINSIISAKNLTKMVRRSTFAKLRP